MRRAERILNLSTLKISAGYLLFGAVWILLSDRLVYALVDTESLSSVLQTVKGWLFVALSAVLIFGLVRIRERQLDTSRQRMAEANQELQVLHRIFRHNIRNDLNIILGYVELVQNKIKTTEDRERLELAFDTAEGIIDMSEKLRIIEEADFQPIDETLEVVSVIDRELDRFESRHPQVTVQVDLPDEIIIRGGRALSHVFREILENAVEHHEGSEPVEIAIEVDQTLTDVEIWIQDNGPGIPTAELEALTSGHETQLSHTSGVGLWLITWLCRLHGGDSSFETAPDGGTVVTLNFQRVTALEQFTEGTLLAEV